MNRDRSAKGVLAAAAIWIAIIAIFAVATKFLILPRFRNQLENSTGSRSRYKNEIIMSADAFSGYSFLRSEQMRNELKANGIKLTVNDDGADYTARMKALKNRDVQMAVFTVDSFIRAGAELGEFPATIVMVIDETKGADAIVAYKSAAANIQDLNDPKAKMVLTPRSPSEFLARTVIAHFNLPDMPSRWIEEADGAEDVYRKFKAANRNEKKAYVLWEPYVSKAMAIPGANLLLDSSRLQGYIVDILVVERNFLREHPEMVQSFVEAYFRAAYYYEHTPGGTKALIMKDALETGSGRLSESQAEKLIGGIEWKNTLENYAYFGLLEGRKAQGYQLLEDIIFNITEVLMKTGAMEADPVGGKAHLIFYDKTLAKMLGANYHPGKKQNAVDGGPGSGDIEGLRTAETLPALSGKEWAALEDVAQMRVAPIAFARGTANLNVQSERDLESLTRTLSAWPRYYLLVVGHARAEGDMRENMRLAEERARAAVDFLISAGVDQNRIWLSAAQPSSNEGTSQAVTFELKQQPY